MQTFVSTLSNQAFPIYEQVKGNEVSASLLEFIRKEHPQFDKTSMIALRELNDYRRRFVESTLERDLGAMNSSDQKFDVDKLVARQLSRDRKSTQHLTFGQRVADRIAAFGGSWSFILSFMGFIFVWMLLNIYLLNTKVFDPYPFILLNLILSCLAALQAPVIMMSQNRQEEKDRERAKNDYMVDLKAELQIRMLHEKIDDLMIRQQEEMFNLQQAQADMLKEILEKISKNA